MKPHISTCQFRIYRPVRKGQLWGFPLSRQLILATLVWFFKAVDVFYESQIVLTIGGHDDKKIASFFLAQNLQCFVQIGLISVTEGNYQGVDSIFVRTSGVLNLLPLHSIVILSLGVFHDFANDDKCDDRDMDEF